MATAPPPAVLARLEARQAARVTKAEEGRAQRADAAELSPSAAADAWHARAAAVAEALAAGEDGAVQAALALDAEAGGLAAGLPPSAAARLGRAAGGLRSAVAAARAVPAFAFPAAAEEGAEGAAAAVAEAAGPAAPAAPAPPRPRPPPPAFSLAGLAGRAVRLGPAALGGTPGAALTLARLRGCTVVIAPDARVASLTISDVEDCRIVVGVASGGGDGGGGGGGHGGGTTTAAAAAAATTPRTVMVDGAAASTLWLAAGQVRVHRAAGLDLYTRGAAGLAAADGAPAPVIEACERVRVAPYLLDGEAAPADPSALPWAGVQDFDWPRAGPSPHWRVLAAEQWAAPPAGPADEVGAALLPS